MSARSSTWLSSASLLLGVALLLHTHGAALQEEPPSDPLVEAFADLDLRVEFPARFVAAEFIEPPLAHARLVAAWKGRHGSGETVVELLRIGLLEGRPIDPEDVSDLLRDDLLAPSEGGARVHIKVTECVSGEYGAAGHAAFLRGRRQMDDGTTQGIFLLSGLLEQDAWTLRLEASPDPGESESKEIRELLIRAVLCGSPPRDPKWKDADLRQGWLDFSPETAQKLEPPARSAHYAVLADCKNGPAFAKKLEGYYTAIQKTLPFEEVPGRMLLPVYLFRTEDEYYDYYARRYATSREEGEELWGHLEGGLYVTYFEDLDNPIHLYYAVQQLLNVRLRLHGGGSWFHSGLAEYLSSKSAQRTPAAKKAKKGEHIPFAEMIRLEWLSATTAREDLTGVDEVDMRYAQVGLVLEFLCEGKWAKAKFPEFLRTVGVVDDEDFAGIEAALAQTYGTDLAGLEKQWIEYCKKR